MATSLCCFFSGCNTHCGKCPTDTVLVRARFAGRIDGLSHRSSIAVPCQFSAIAKVVYGGANVFFGFSYVAWRTAGCALFLREVFRAHLSGCKNALRKLLTGTSFFLGCMSVGPGNCPAEERCGLSPCTCVVSYVFGHVPFALARMLQVYRRAFQSIFGLEHCEPGQVVSAVVMASIEKFISQPPLIIHSSLAQLRYLILSEGLPAYNDKQQQRLRCYIWSILSRTSMERSTQVYLSFLQLGAVRAPIIQKIKNDTFRTLQTDPKFITLVSEDSLIRCLSCFAWQSVRLADSDPNFQVSTYVQGMNVLLAPLLYCCPSEPMAFQLFSTLCYSIIPTYLNNNLSGVHKGAKLLDICLKIIDPKLSKFLSDNLLTAEIYGIPSILTLSSCNKPLDQVCKLWDFMFAYGFHMNILFVVAILVQIRSKILKSDSPMNLLTRQLPDFDADEIIKLGVGFVAKIPSDIYNLLVEHLTDPNLVIPY